MTIASTAAGQGSSSTPPRVATNAPTPTVRSESLELEVGEQRVISSEGVQSYSEGSKGIVDVRLTKDASQFIVVGLREGTTTVLFLMLDGTEKHVRITVSDPNAQKAQGNTLRAVEARDNIRLDFYFVQLNRSSGYQIGLGWPGTVAPTMSATMDLTTGRLDSATAVISNQALPRLDMGQSSGWAKIMRQTAVVTANGEKATFSGGGEVNVAITSAMTTGIQKIPYGSQIEVEPIYDSKSGRIELRIHADVSELETDQGTGVPGRTTAALDTLVNLELGQSLVLGGLTAKSERSGKAGIPILSQIPILGVFFGSHNHSESETENVVIIVPSVVDAVSMQDRERLANALRRYTEYSGDLEDGARFVPEPKMRNATPPVKP
ncbi:MAG: pilus assembly protein N-terminal domain-containing protein [Polyangiaceae bacterium]